MINLKPNPAAARAMIADAAIKKGVGSGTPTGIENESVALIDIGYC